MVLVVLAAQGVARGVAQPEFRGFSMRLTAPMREKLEGRFWRPGCPVGLSQLRVLTLRHYAFDGRVRTGQLVVNEVAAAPLLRVFRRLYEERFPIRTMRFKDAYGDGPVPRDTTASFMCRQAAASPCIGGRSSTWSMHAYGLAVDLNPVENPYVGLTCGRVHDPTSRPYVDRTPLRKGMVTPAVVRAFRSIGWGWGGDWTTTKDYMHFSATGR
jgi:hypothetical protein